ncbi:LysR family transcriptional regulator [Granulicella sp. S156]|uniref:LysR family transcriptional regulator n=1 Tax=Granulicella sp. S156 TaxID=1747224 RepID=UPI00131C97DF|nr:LysR family transcriptional regulator [Granulicella sp. S156]
MYILSVNIASLNLNLLAALDALLQEESVSRAGMKVGLSQPAMSHSLEKLRDLLGDPLLVRVGGKMELTLRAQSLRPQVRDTVERVREIFVSDTFIPALSTRTFRIVMSDYASNLLLPALSRSMQAQAPATRIEIHPWRGNIAASFQNAPLPDAVVACQTQDVPGFKREFLFSDRDICVLRSNHPLCTKRLDLKTFLNAAHVGVVPVEFTPDPIDEWLEELGHTRRVIASVPHYMDALHLVAQSDLIAVIPERLARAHSSILNLVNKSVPLDVGSFDEYLLHSARTHADAGCVWLRNLIRNVSNEPRIRAKPTRTSNPAVHRGRSVSI